jgi:7,8-dihydropterin-6-yl-methyl-4-(beta-D-ribofuranosyl)aminobenzene 5'-phosphate synthase
MRLTLLAEGSTPEQRSRNHWGIAFLINERMIFDTFGHADVFMSSLAIGGVSLAQISDIVISHDHWDHLAGLWPLLEKSSRATVYLCPGFSQQTKHKIKATGASFVEIVGSKELYPGIFTTGCIGGIYQDKEIEEQAIVAKTPKGLIVLTGCAHPGIVNIVQRVRKNFDQPVTGLIGGFHLNDKGDQEIKAIAFKLKQLGVENISPLHCTGERAQNIFKKIFLEGYHNLKVGFTVEFV